MRRTTVVLLVATLAITACNSRLNPGNWFGRGQDASGATVEGEANGLLPEESGFSLMGSREKSESHYPGTTISRIVELRVDRIPGGAIIYAKGIAHVQGANTAKLEPMNNGKPENGVLTYRFLAIHPANPSGVGTDRSREIIVGHRLSDQQLEGVRSIRVEGVKNALVSRR